MKYLVMVKFKRKRDGEMLTWFPWKVIETSLKGWSIPNDWKSLDLHTFGIVAEFIVHKENTPQYKVNYDERFKL